MSSEAPEKDEWGPWLAHAMREPEFAALYRAAEAELDSTELSEDQSDG